MREIVEKISPRPRRCSWEITLKCNFKCQHCGSSAGGTASNELTTDEALDLCDQLADLGCSETTLLGGEPFLRKDWDVIASRLVSHGIDVNIVSNGSLIDQDLVEQLSRIGIRRIGISIDGLEPTHNAVRGKAGAFESCLLAAERLRRADISVCIVTVVFERNLDELPTLLNLLEEKGIRHWQLQLPVPKGRFAEGSLSLPEDAVVRLTRFIASARRTSSMTLYAGCNVGYFGEDEELIRTPHGEGLGFWTGCYAGVLLVSIKSNGDVTGCLTMPPELTEGNVRERSLSGIWNSTDSFAYNRQFRKELLGGSCAVCPHADICRGGCRTMSYYTTGSLFDDPYCEYRSLEAAGRQSSPMEVRG